MIYGTKNWPRCFVIRFNRCPIYPAGVDAVGIDTSWIRVIHPRVYDVTVIDSNKIFLFRFSSTALRRAGVDPIKRKCYRM